MFNVSALLLDDAPLKCVVTEVVLFSTVAFKTLIQGSFHKVVYRHTWGVVGSLVTVLLQMFSWFRQWNKFENRSIFDEVKSYKTKYASFWATLYMYCKCMTIWFLFNDQWVWPCWLATGNAFSHDQIIRFRCRWLKTYLTSTMSQQRLNNLCLLSIECEVTDLVLRNLLTNLLYRRAS